jgi:hypothetical protein
VASDVATIAGGVTVLAGAATAASVGVVLLRRPKPYLTSGHALVGMQCTDPLTPVFRNRLGGLTVPVRPGPRGELFIGTGAPEPGRTLRRLVLSPLLARAKAAGGRVAREERAPFRLVVEFTGPVRDAETLLSRCVDGRLEPGAVTVTIAGIVDVRELLASQRRRYAFAEGTFDDIGCRSAPPALVPIISECWTRRFGWDGREPIPAEERHLLHALVRSAHADGRSVRISGLANGGRQARRAVWGELCAAGVDVIADADQAALARHLRRHPIRRPDPSPPAMMRRRPAPRPTAPRSMVNNG